MARERIRSMAKATASEHSRRLAAEASRRGWQHSPSGDRLGLARRWNWRCRFGHPFELQAQSKLGPSRHDRIGDLVWGATPAGRADTIQLPTSVSVTPRPRRYSCGRPQSPAPAARHSSRLPPVGGPRRERRPCTYYRPAHERAQTRVGCRQPAGVIFDHRHTATDRARPLLHRGNSASGHQIMGSGLRRPGLGGARAAKACMHRRSSRLRGRPRLCTARCGGRRQPR